MRSYRVKYIEDCPDCHGMGQRCKGYDDKGPIYGRKKCKRCKGTGRVEGEADLGMVLGEIIDQYNLKNHSGGGRW